MFIGKYNRVISELEITDFIRVIVSRDVPQLRKAIRLLLVEADRKSSPMLMCKGTVLGVTDQLIIGGQQCSKC